MEVLKKFGIWIGMGVAVLVLLVLQFVVVGSKRVEVIKDFEEMNKKFKSLKALAGKTDKIPTKGDVQAAEKHGDKIRAMGSEVEQMWRRVTGALNKYLGNEGGLVMHPEKNELIQPVVFPEDIRNLYKDLFRDTRRAIGRKMLPRISQMYADELWAGSALYTEERAKEEGEKLARERIKQLLPSLAAEELIPVKLGDVFNVNQPEQMWKEWRTYLIARDLLTRVVGNCEVEVARNFMVPKPLDDEERAKLYEEDLNNPEDIVTAGDRKAPEFAAVDKPSWRYIEEISRFEVRQIEVGNAELPAADSTATETAQKGKRAGGEDADRDDGKKKKKKNSSGRGGNAAEEEQFHDVYRVTIEVKAHIAVVWEFMRKVLDVEDLDKDEMIFYVPVGVTINRLNDTDVIGDYKSAESKRWSGSGFLGGSGNLSDKAHYIASFFHEPPVLATLEYDVYRFRYEDTDNADRLVGGDDRRR